MSTPEDHTLEEEPPRWALDQAGSELYDMDDRSAIRRRAWEIVRDAEERESERHDEYDDPDQGGEG